MCLDLRQKKQSNKETVHLMEPPAKILSRFVEIWTLKGVGERRGTQGCLSPFSFPPPLPSPFPFSSFSLSVSSSLPFSPFSLPSLSLPPPFHPSPSSLLHLPPIFSFLPPPFLLHLPSFSLSSPFSLAPIFCPLPLAPCTPGGERQTAIIPIVGLVVLGDRVDNQTKSYYTTLDPDLRNFILGVVGSGGSSFEVAKPE